MIDFEKSMINALRYHFPYCKIFGCLFHFAQNVFKKIINLGLATRYLTDPSIYLFFKNVIALTQVPPHEFELKWLQIQFIDAPITREMNDMIEYLNNTYFGSSDQIHNLQQLMRLYVFDAKNASKK
jgi:hypothetical protein